VLSQAGTQPSLLAHTRSPALIDALAATGWLAAEEAARLRDAHAALLASALACTLDARPRLVASEAALQPARDAVRLAWQRRSATLEDASPA
jgi:glutamate-ammonia-ligase adenylyltransferase